MVIPSLPNSEAVFTAAGVLGATIMPHVIYLHSSLTQHLHGGTRQQRYAATKWDVAIAMTIAGFVNLAMMATAAAAFHFSGHTGIADLDQAYLTLEPLLSHAAATVFGLSPVAAGLFYRGRYAGGAGGDARVYPFSHSAMGTPYRHHDAIIYCDSDGIGSDPYSGDESGVAQFWYRAGAGAAADLHQRQ